MRKINPHDFKVARRGTSRAINRQIALSLIRAHQPISRADLARLMNVRRGVASLLVSELLEEGLIFEGAVGEAVGRGRRPTFLYIDTRQRCVVGVDVRASRTYIMITDLMGKQIGTMTFLFRISLVVSSNYLLTTKKSDLALALALWFREWWTLPQAVCSMRRLSPGAMSICAIH